MANDIDGPNTDEQPDLLSPGKTVDLLKDSVQVMLVDKHKIDPALISVAWINMQGDQSRTHYAQNLNQAVCGQFFHENFQVIPHAFGARCKPCRKWLTDRLKFILEQ